MVGRTDSHDEFGGRLRSIVFGDLPPWIVSDIILPFLWLAERPLPSFGWQPVEYEDLPTLHEK